MRDTKRGERCGQVCTDDNGRKRYRFVPNAVCEGASGDAEEDDSGIGTNPEVVEFSGLSSMVDFKSVKMEPVPLLPLVGLVDSRRDNRRFAEGSRRRKRRLEG